MLKESHMTVRAISLNHRIPSFAFVLEEPFHINIHKEALHKAGLPVGSWLKEVKQHIWAGQPDSYRFTATLYFEHRKEVFRSGSGKSSKPVPSDGEAGRHPRKKGSRSGLGGLSLFAPLYGVRGKNPTGSPNSICWNGNRTTFRGRRPTMNKHIEKYHHANSMEKFRKMLKG
jgi:hypothetical protein